MKTMTYEERVDNFLRREKIHALTPVDDEEPYFSSSPCECCGARGAVCDCIALNYETRDIIKYVVCWDCVLYTTNGVLEF